MRTFEIYECGDPYSKAWDCSETDASGTFYRGDISGRYSKSGLIAYLTRQYPGCRIVERV